MICASASIALFQTVLLAKQKELMTHFFRSWILFFVISRNILSNLLEVMVVIAYTGNFCLPVCGARSKDDIVDLCSYCLTLVNGQWSIGHP